MNSSTKFALLAIVGVLVVGSGFATDSYETMKTFGILVAAWMTLAIYSFLYQDNPVYKFAEHVFVGIAAAYGAILIFWGTIVPNVVHQLVTPAPELTGAALRDWSPQWLLIVPVFFGLCFFTRFSKKYDYMVRWSLAFLIGGFAGARLTGFAEADLVQQAAATMLPISGIDFFPPAPYLRVGEYGMNHMIIIVGVIATLAYFFFSKPHRGALGVTAKAGIWFLLIGRLTFLMSDWLGVV